MPGPACDARAMTDAGRADAEGAAEQPLAGGRATRGVVRVGDTVRRPPRDNAAFARALLRHLEDAAPGLAPAFLGQDAQGRDMLGWIAGDVEPSLRDYDDAAVIAAARLLRRLHDATRGTALAGESEVACHFDCGPYNAIFRDGLPVAWIDFDMAAPGRAIDDLAYLLWMWSISSQANRAPLAAQCRQAALAARHYGLASAERAGLVAAIIGRIDGNIRYWEAALRDLRRVAVSEEKAHAMLRWSHDERAHMLRHKAAFSAALDAG